MPEQHADEVTAVNEQRLVEDWTSCFRQAQAAITESLGPLQTATDPTAWQRAWSDAVGRSANAFLRSPPFLEMMRNRLAALIREQTQATTDQSVDSVERIAARRGVIAHRPRRLKESSTIRPGRSPARPVTKWSSNSPCSA